MEKLAPHQKHYRAKMRQHGWMDTNSEMIWPADVAGRQKMARGLFGVKMASNVDYWTLLAEDELDGTHQAPWASPDKAVRPEAAHHREIFQSLKPEQREAFRELLRYVMKGQLYSFCLALDQTLGGSTVSLEQPNDNHGDRLEIHSPSQEELHHEQHQWLENFSILFGKDERYATEA